MSAYHPALADGKWNALSLTEQLANIGSKVERSLSWCRKGNGDCGRPKPA